MRKQRLDTLLVERGLAESIESARAFIGAGRVLVEGQPADKAGMQFKTGCTVEIKEIQRYVSRGGQKLEAGLQYFGINPREKVCADIGCSTGGFTDCLLQHGAEKVYSVDVGYGVLDWKLRQDERVVVLERKNARYLTREDIPEPVDLAVIDASFISLELLLEPVSRMFDGAVSIVALVKPQFELPRDKVTTGGVIRERSLHEEALEKIRAFAASVGLECRGIVASPISGAKGNREFLMHIVGEQENRRKFT
ncbi:MAG TPA: TlyA family RNA methyltransferase [Desulfobacteraceae bacterium]|nr:TlyA family RNA methyltransferase [Desulfobacteraceae bacterium]